MPVPSHPHAHTHTRGPSARARDSSIRDDSNSISSSLDGEGEIGRSDDTLLHSPAASRTRTHTHTDSHTQSPAVATKKATAPKIFSLCTQRRIARYEKPSEQGDPEAMRRLAELHEQQGDRERARYWRQLSWQTDCPNPCTIIVKKNGRTCLFTPKPDSASASAPAADHATSHTHGSASTAASAAVAAPSRSEADTLSTTVRAAPKTTTTTATAARPPAAVAASVSAPVSVPAAVPSRWSEREREETRPADPHCEFPRLQKQAANGNANSRYNLAEFLLQRGGVQDKQTVMFWLSKAAEQGHKPARKLLQALTASASVSVAASARASTPLRTQKRSQPQTPHPAAAARAFSRVASPLRVHIVPHLTLAAWQTLTRPTTSDLCLWFCDRVRCSCRCALALPVARTRTPSAHAHMHTPGRLEASALKSIRDRAERGHPDAQYQLGLYFARVCANQPGDEASAATAVRWFEKAAEQGHIQAMAMMWYCTDRGVGVETGDAADWLVQARFQGHLHRPRAPLDVTLCRCVFLSELRTSGRDCDRVLIANACDSASVCQVLCQLIDSCGQPDCQRLVRKLKCIAKEPFANFLFFETSDFSDLGLGRNLGGM